MFLLRFVLLLGIITATSPFAWTTHASSSLEKPIMTQGRCRPTHTSALSPSSSSVVPLAANGADLNMNSFTYTSMPIRSSTSLHSLPPSSLAVSAALRGGGAGAAGMRLGPAIALNMAVGCILASLADLLAQSSKLDFGSDRRHFQSPYLLALRGTAGKRAKLRRRINTIKREVSE